MKPFRASLCILLGHVLVAPALAAPHYTIFDVQGAGTQSGQGTLPVALNDSSVIAGLYIDSNFNNHGFVRASDGTITTFDVAGPSSQTQPMSMNREGTIVGFYVPPNDPIISKGFLRKASGRIRKFSAGGVSTGVRGLNDKGMAVGTYATKSHHIIGYVRAVNGSITDIRDPKGGKQEFDGTFPMAINNAGVIIGQYVNQHKIGGFVRNTDGTFTNFYIAGAGVMGIAPSAINRKGLVAGIYYDSNQASHGFIRDPAGTITTFDAPGAGTGPQQGTSPTSIADDGTIVGTYTDANNVNHGFLRMKNGSIREFDAPGAGTGSYQGTFVSGINDTHVIAGGEVDSNGVDHGFLRTP